MKHLCSAAFFFMSCLTFAKEKQLITIYTYHVKPPMVIDAPKKLGLYYDFTAVLNRTSNAYRFETIFVPRKRIERMLENNTLDGILLGVNPLWFQDKNESKYLWTSRIFTDRDEIVSLTSQSIEYINNHSLEGKIFGGVRGFYYFGINELVSQNKIVRVDTTNEIDLFTMLLNQRIDAAVISRSTFDFIVRLNGWQNRFYLSKKPHDIFDRRILVPKKYHEVYQHISPIINHLQFDQSWTNKINKYR